MDIQIKPAELYRDNVIALLTTEKLPTSDLAVMLSNFFVAVNNGEVIGVGGLETYGAYGLLRSVATARAWRGQGIASQLLNKIEALAADLGLKAIYLFTESSRDYFETKGYEHIARMDIPEEVKGSSEFAHICPESATAMQKSL
ncbi:arsenic resistance N-acetyltransferase ArsN2 [Mucilaginibacter sp. AK015]|uniref:arsenic resistance N-acetyltransferase ArsN2 n=1 Tax=Mucilaginibacter sp. AK015 TaxID=2723072 RepID=UPI001619B5F7|nr:arsenic resistance N-acetyltransferase ArsN2 [Mucilaginibacter sp. AK015]MBB5394692.1 amino-acid N-acetyltransferase [Mucilaginibacter sp. AK015]